MPAGPKTPSRPSFLRRVLRATGTLIVTLAFLGAAGFAVVAGSQALTARAAAVPPPDAAALVQVSTSPIRVEPGYTVERRYVGQVESAANVQLSFELGGRLTALNVAEGDRVAKGQEIARLDTAILEADRDRLQASRAATQTQLNFAERQFQRATALQQEGFASQETVDQNRTTRDELQNRLAEIDASLASVRINLEKSVLLAPFDGQIGAQSVDGAETLSAGAPVVTLIATETPEVRIGLPLSIAASDLQDVTIEIGGQRYDATLSHLRPDIDAVTRTRTALFRIAGAPELLFGETATLLVNSRNAIEGAWVPLDALQEGVSGAWTVLVVQDGVVRNATVEVLHSEATRAFVRGTFTEGAALIDRGAHRVVPGQQVAALGAEG